MLNQNKFFRVSLFVVCLAFPLAAMSYAQNETAQNATVQSAAPATTEQAPASLADLVVGCLGGGQVMGPGADTADVADGPRHFLHGAAFAEFFKAA